MQQTFATLRHAFGPSGSFCGAVERHEVSSGAIYTWPAGDVGPADRGDRAITAKLR